MRIFITGVRGFIGRKLIESINSRMKHTHYNVQVLAPSRSVLDLTDGLDVKTWLDGYSPDVIIHLAANPNNKPDKDHPEQIIQDNILATHNICYYAPQGARVIFASSISVYGETPYPVSERHPREPTTIYGVTKLACENIVDLYTNQGKIRGVSLRFCAAVGSGLTHGMLYDFHRKIKEPGDELEVLGDKPGSIKPFIHVSDVVNAILFMIDKPYITFPVNILPDGLVTVEEVANMLIEITDSDKEIKWLGNDSVWQGDINVLQASNILMKQLSIPMYHHTSDRAIYDSIRDQIYNDKM